MAMDKYNFQQQKEKFYEEAYKEYGKTAEELEEYVDIVMKWGETQPHLPEKLIRNGVRFSIVACKLSVERVKEKVDMYYTIRNLMPEIYRNHPLSPEMMKQHSIITCVPMPKLTENHHRLIYWRLNPESDPEDFNTELLLTQITHVIEVLLMEDSCYNFDFVYDFEGAKLAHLPRFNPMVVKKLGICMEKVYANRVSVVYLVNFYPFLENLLNTVFRPLMPKKIRERMKVFENTDIIVQKYDKSILPKDFGGEEKSLKELQEMWIEKLIEYKDRFDKLQYMQTDESKRPTKLVNDDILGYYGNFKKINVD